jgi:hypothetical protein
LRSDFDEVRFAEIPDAGCVLELSAVLLAICPRHGLPNTEWREKDVTFFRIRGQWIQGTAGNQLVWIAGHLAWVMPLMASAYWYERPRVVVEGRRPVCGRCVPIRISLPPWMMTQGGSVVDQRACGQS